MHLGEIDDEVKRQLVILLLKVPETKQKKNFSEGINSLSGAWRNNGLSAEEEIRQIYDARTSGNNSDSQQSRGCHREYKALR